MWWNLSHVYRLSRHSRVAKVRIEEKKKNEHENWLFPRCRTHEWVSHLRSWFLDRSVRPWATDDGRDERHNLLPSNNFRSLLFYDWFSPCREHSRHISQKSMTSETAPRKCLHISISGRKRQISSILAMLYRTCALVGWAPPWNSIVPYASVGWGRVCLFGNHESPGEPGSMPTIVGCVWRACPQQHLNYYRNRTRTKTQCYNLHDYITAISDISAKAWQNHIFVRHIFRIEDEITINYFPS